MSTNNGGRAFPVPMIGTDQSGFTSVQYEGMTLRDYFAAAALTGLYAGGMDAATYEKDAEGAYKAADAMLAVRSVEASS